MIVPVLIKYQHLRISLKIYRKKKKQQQLTQHQLLQLLQSIIFLIEKKEKKMTTKIWATQSVDVRHTEQTVFYLRLIIVCEICEVIAATNKSSRTSLFFPNERRRLVTLSTWLQACSPLGQFCFKLRSRQADCFNVHFTVIFWQTLPNIYCSMVISTSIETCYDNFHFCHGWQVFWINKGSAAQGVYPLLIR